MKETICKYCNQKIIRETVAELGGHVTQCHKNPNKNLAIQRRLNTQDKIKHEFTFSCKKCDKDYVIISTKYNVEQGNYKKHCSRMCANSRTWIKWV